LPVSGPGYEVLHLGRNRRYGHPELVAFVKRLGATAKAKKLGLLVVGDLSQPRGGPTPSGHRSHQTGLDVDLGYAAPMGVRAGHLSAADRERLGPVVVVDLKTHLATPAWKPKTVALLAAAAADPAVDRIFVNPAVKRMLCDGQTRKAPWAGRIRPWWGHHDHFHVRLKCPEGSPACLPQDPPPDDGCGPSLGWWFGSDAEATRDKKKQADVDAGPKVPEACSALLTPPAGVAAR
jgi:penicillin-insensitive murein endopeptidase